MKNICIIPARGGSKRIPHKNIKVFCGKPIIAYSIEAALEAKIFDEVMVSTDDEEIAIVAKKYGASVPFMRSEETANDYAIIKDVMCEVLSKYKNEGKAFENICCILPTAPFVSAQDIIDAHKLLAAGVTSVVPVVQFSYTIFRSLKICDDGRLEMFWPENYSKRSQDLPAAYHDAGLFYWYGKSYFEESVAGFGENFCGYVLSEMKAHDIDTEDDWEMAEMKYRLMNSAYDTIMTTEGGYLWYSKNTFISLSYIFHGFYFLFLIYSFLLISIKNKKTHHAFVCRMAEEVC